MTQVISKESVCCKPVLLRVNVLLVSIIHVRYSEAHTISISNKVARIVMKENRVAYEAK